MKQDSVKNAVSALTLTTVANVWIQNSIVNSEPIALSGRCQGTGGRKKLKRGDREIIDGGNRGASGLLSLRDGSSCPLTERACCVPKEMGFLLFDKIDILDPRGK